MERELLKLQMGVRVVLECVVQARENQAPQQKFIQDKWSRTMEFVHGLDAMQ